MDHAPRLSLTPTAARQAGTPSFGEALQGALGTGAALARSVLGSLPMAGLVSAAVSHVVSVAQAGRSTASAPAGGSVVAALSAASGEVTPGLGGYVEQMRAEADRSLLMQLQMQQESREYNTLSNVLKVRHDSAKAAINNVR